MSEVAETLGQRLKAERERKGWSAQKVADDLHLDGWVIDGLESDDYARVGPSVYVKGHLKRYAELLGLPAAEILAAYAGQSSAPTPAARAATTRVRTSEPAGGELSWLPVAGVVVALGVIGMLWWKPWHPRTAAAPAATAALSDATASAVPAASQSAQPDVSGGAGVAAEGVSDRGELTEGAPVAVAFTPAATGGAAVGSAGKSASAVGSAGMPASSAVGSAGKSASAVGQNGTDPMAGVGRARLRLSFSADAWVDVRDALGQRVFAGNGRANSVRTVAGAAPLRVYLKSASGVQLEINHHAVAIGRQFVAGDIARFEAGADGVLRRDAHAAPASGAAPAAQHPRG
jgi:cytoskeleton protein RodZ